MADKPPVKMYLSHRENQRERILNAAETLFIQHGIEKTSLSMIAQAAGITRKTFYEYFPNKQEVAWAILQKIFRQSGNAFNEEQPGTGLQRIEALMLYMVNQLEQNPDHFRFIVEFDALYAREANAARMLQVTGRGGPGEVGGRVHSLVRLGMQDGSLRPDLNPDLTAAAIWNLLSGMNSRFALLGNLIAQEYNWPALSIYREIIHAFLRGIQALAKSA